MLHYYINIEQITKKKKKTIIFIIEECMLRVSENKSIISVIYRLSQLIIESLQSILRFILYGIIY
jgi:hypothetical protein